MSLPERVTHEFVEFIPSDREFGKVYISIPYATAVHDCLCGCGMKVVTPIKPNKWTLTYDGEAISLNPSIGNWSFPCRSHYWIRDNEVLNAGQMPNQAIDFGRERDNVITEQYYARKPSQSESKSTVADASMPVAEDLGQVKSPSKPGFWRKLIGLWRR